MSRPLAFVSVLATDMDRRTHESPMDFEYQNGTGPMDGRSPFAQISMNTRNTAANNNNDKKRMFWFISYPCLVMTTFMEEIVVDEDATYNT